MEDEDLMEPELGAADYAEDMGEGELIEAEAEPEEAGNGELLPEMVAAQDIDLVTVLDDTRLAQIARKCLDTYERDKEERKDWEEGFDKIMALVKSKRTTKMWPWPGASNVKYPLIIKAALKFGARSYPAIVNGTDVVKSAAVGSDPNGEKRKRGDRVSMHMNWQLLLDMPEWDMETDRLCHSLPLQGTMFRQVIWDAEYGRPLTTLISGKDLVVTQAAKDLETVPHFAKEFPLFIHQIMERMNTGQYRKVDLGMNAPEDSEEAGKQEMLECHCRYDMDGDGYDEPWIAIIHKESQQILSLKAGFWPNGVVRGQDGKVIRIRRHVEFIKYEFLPDPDGLFYGIGFGQMLLEDSEVINTILNQLIDAATDQNTGGGFIARGFNVAGGNLEFSRGEWKFVNIDADDIRKAFIERPTSQPSPVLFNLLQLLIDAARDMSSDQDVMDGKAPANTPATTVLATIEEATKVYSSIHKRIYRSLTKELRLIAQLNGAYLSPEQYQSVIDMEPVQGPDGQPVMPDPKADYEQQSHDIIPVSDPSMATSAQKLARAQFLMQLGAGNPLLNQREIMRRALEAGSIDDIESLMPQPGPEEQAMQKERMQMELRAAMAEIMGNEASATDDMMAARLKFIEGNAKAQTMVLEAAAMRMSLQQMMGVMGMMGGGFGQQTFGPPMGGMAGVPGQPNGAGPVQGAAPQGGMGPPAMGGAPMGGPPAGPGGPIPSGNPPNGAGVPVNF